MSLKKPFHRNYRAIIEKPNSGYSDWAYIVDKEYAVAPEHYTRAFLIIQEDIKRLFEFIEPADINLQTYSYRIHDLFMRICMEVETNFKAILHENIYTKKSKNKKNVEDDPRNENEWNITDFKKINKTHHLDSYYVEYPIWNGSEFRFQPFKDWKKTSSLCWYQDYNKCKHDRYGQFALGNFNNLLNSFAGLFVLLSSQFKDKNFSHGPELLAVVPDGYYDGSFGIGDFLKIEFPNDWTEDEKYDFDWKKLKEDPNRFEKIDYNDPSFQ